MGVTDLAEPATLAVVTAVAETKGVSPAELTPLATVIDPDALEALFGSPSDNRYELRFEYEDCTVFVTNDAEVTVRAHTNSSADKPSISSSDFAER
ncbi:MAG: HalOD1 output domain-containing protein [Halapricum sp.]